MARRLRAATRERHFEDFDDEGQLIRDQRFHRYLQEDPRDRLVRELVLTLDQRHHGLIRQRSFVGIVQLKCDFVVVLVAAHRQQAVPIHLVDLEQHEDIFPQQFFNVLRALTVMLRHHKAQQVLVHILAQVDLSVFVALDELNHFRPRF